MSPKPSVSAAVTFSMHFTVPDDDDDDDDKFDEDDEGQDPPRFPMTVPPLSPPTGFGTSSQRA